MLTTRPRGQVGCCVSYRLISVGSVALLSLMAAARPVSKRFLANVCMVDDDGDGSLLKSRRRLCSPHQPVVSRHLLPLSVEARFVRDIIDRVSILITSSTKYKL